jgi:hypothetical protein
VFFRPILSDSARSRRLYATKPTDGQRPPAISGAPDPERSLRYIEQALQLDPDNQAAARGGQSRQGRHHCRYASSPMPYPRKSTMDFMFD